MKGSADHCDFFAAQTKQKPPYQNSTEVFVLLFIFEEERYNQIQMAVFFIRLSDYVYMLYYNYDILVKKVLLN